MLYILIAFEAEAGNFFDAESLSPVDSKKA